MMGMKDIGQYKTKLVINSDQWSLPLFDLIYWDIPFWHSRTIRRRRAITKSFLFEIKVRSYKSKNYTVGDTDLVREIWIICGSHRLEPQ